MEMTGSWKAWKSKSSFSPLPTPPWKSRQQREIPTFPQPGVAPDGKVENHNQVFHFPTRVARRQLRFILFRNQTPSNEIGRFAASSHFLGSLWNGNADSNQETSCRGGHRRGTTISVLAAARWPVLK
jgi:hypothetical protein